ncbi:NADH dehydrogenase [ubiquinone] 1 beta subcomplex subunit 3-B [Linum grandiflorum]
MGKPLGSTGEFFRRRDEWRKHPMLTNQFRHALPGFGIGVAAFAVYLIGEQIFNRVGAPSSSASHSH